MVRSEKITVREIELGDVVKTAYVRRKKILIITGAVFLFSVIYSLVASKKYTGVASFFLPAKTSSPMQNLSSDKLPQFLSSYLSESGSKSKLFISFLKSRTLTDEVINHFDLMKYYKESTMDKTRRKLLGDAVFKSEASDVITISIENKSPETAAQIANFYLTEVDKLQSKLNITEAGRQRLFLEERIENVKKELTDAEDILAAFQIKNNVLNIEDQASATINLISSLEGELLKSKIELGVLNSYASEGDINIHRLKQSIKETEIQIQKLTQKTTNKKSFKNISDKNDNSEIMIPAKMLPEISTQYLRLLRNVKLLQTVYSMLTQQYELAKVEEAKDSSTIMILDQAVVPKIKSKPKRTLIVLISTILAAILSLAFFSAMDILKPVLNDLRKIEAEV